MILKILSLAREEIKEGYLGATTRYAENTTATLSVANGYFTGVVSATYWGQDNYCSQTNTIGDCNISCSTYCAAGAWHTNEYGGSDVKEQVKTLCKISASTRPNSCSFGVNNGNFGDPAWGRGKKLDLQMDFGCNEGFYKSTNGCVVCASGTFSPGGGATSCTGCKAGQYYDGSSKTCIDCPAGKFNPSANTSGSTSCQTCVAGTYSAAGASKCEECSAGTYALEGATSCTSCKAGTYSSTPKASSETTCIKCPAGKYSSKDGASSCDDCPAGKYSTNTGATSSAGCIDCPAGKFSSGGMGYCYDCPVGKYSTSTGATSSNTCMDCGVNTYNSLTGQTTCLTCPTGTVSGIGASICSAVEAGKYINASGIKTECPPGYKCPAYTGQYIKCPSGTFSPAGKDTCTECSAGQYSKPGSGSISDCKNLNLSMQYKSDHPDGFRCLNGYVKVAEVGIEPARCEACKPGFYSNIAEAPDATVCSRCSTSTHSGAVAKECIANVEGQERSENTESGFRCLNGFFKTGNTPSHTCVKCLAGTYAIRNESQPSSDPTQCTPCNSDRGESSPAGADKCDGCKEGQYYDRTSKLCVKNTAGYYSTNGAVQQYICPAGTYCPEISSTQGARAPVPCPKGYYGETPGVVSSTCTGACPTGTYCGTSASDTGFSAPITCDLDTSI